MVTIEPIMDFDIDCVLDDVRRIKPNQINIGADSGGHKLLEPPKEKIFELIDRLENSFFVYEKNNLKRLLK